MIGELLAAASLEGFFLSISSRFINCQLRCLEGCNVTRWVQLIQGALRRGRLAKFARDSLKSLLDASRGGITEAAVSQFSAIWSLQGDTLHDSRLGMLWRRPTIKMVDRPSSFIPLDMIQNGRGHTSPFTTVLLFRLALLSAGICLRCVLLLFGK